MRAVMTDVLSVRGLLKILLQAGEAVILCAFRFTNASSFNGWRPPRS
jgi:hypothetical protein